jgi:hypothetical protein
MFVDTEDDLVVVDIKDGRVLPEFNEKEHPGHPTKIKVQTINGKTEPVLLYKDGKHIPETNILSKKEIYFWRYTGSTCECIWCNGKCILRCKN